VDVVSSGVSTKLKIVAGVIAAGGIIGGTAGLNKLFTSKHKHREIQDS
jgi:hypothetical protein